MEESQHLSRGRSIGKCWAIAISKMGHKFPSNQLEKVVEKVGTVALHTWHSTPFCNIM
jgi:hypothetical protein